MSNGIAREEFVIRSFNMSEVFFYDFTKESCLVDSPFEGGQGDVFSFCNDLSVGVLFF